MMVQVQVRKDADRVLWTDFSIALSPMYGGEASYRIYGSRN